MLNQWLTQVSWYDYPILFFFVRLTFILNRVGKDRKIFITNRKLFCNVYVCVYVCVPMCVVIFFSVTLFVLLTVSCAWFLLDLEL